MPEDDVEIGVVVVFSLILFDEMGEPFPLRRDEEEGPPGLELPLTGAELLRDFCGERVGELVVELGLEGWSRE